MRWGVESDVVERFGAAGVPEANISFARETWRFNLLGTPSDLLAIFRDYYGPTMNAYAAAEADGKADVLDFELETLFNSHNTATQAGTTSIPATFLRVTVRR